MFSILLDCILFEFMKIGPEDCNGGISIRVDNHMILVHERSYNLVLTIHHDFTVLAMGKKSCVCLLGQTLPYLFIVLCFMSVCIDACSEYERYVGCLECDGINLAVYSNQAGVFLILVQEF